MRRCSGVNGVLPLQKNWISSQAIYRLRNNRSREKWRTRSRGKEISSLSFWGNPKEDKWGWTLLAAHWLEGKEEKTPSCQRRSLSSLRGRTGRTEKPDRFMIEIAVEKSSLCLLGSGWELDRNNRPGKKIKKEKCSIIWRIPQVTRGGLGFHYILKFHLEKILPFHCSDFTSRLLLFFFSLFFRGKCSGLSMLCWLAYRTYCTVHNAW